MTLTFAGVVQNIIAVGDNVVKFIIAAAMVVFMWGLVKYLSNSGDEEARKDSVNYMVAGIIGLFVMVAIWAIIAIVAKTFGFSLLYNP